MIMGIIVRILCIQWIVTTMVTLILMIINDKITVDKMQIKLVKPFDIKIILFVIFFSIFPIANIMITVNEYKNFRVHMSYINDIKKIYDNEINNLEGLLNVKYKYLNTNFYAVTTILTFEEKYELIHKMFNKNKRYFKEKIYYSVSARTHIGFEVYEIKYK